MATTTNYGWTTPDDTALVKDGAAAIRTLGSSIDSTLKTQIDAQIPDSLLTTKGDLIAATGASTPARLAVGTNGQVLVADSTVATGVKWATPVSGALTWTNRLNINAGEPIQQIAYNGSNLYVAVTQSGTLYTSPDALTWTSRTSGFGANGINDVAYGNGLWVAVGDNGTLTTSSNGTTWTARTANMSTNAIRNVVYANSLWVAVGSGGGTTNTGGVIYSSDGTTWTRKSQSLTVGNQYQCVVWNGTNWIIGSTLSGVNAFLYASDPSGTWTAASTTAQAGTITWIGWDGTRHTFCEANAFYFSTSTTLATTTVYGGLPSINANVKTTKLYSNNVYLQSAGWIQSFNTSSTQYGSYVTTPILTPSQLVGTTGTLSSNMNCMSVFAAGYIIGTASGQIYTSF